MADRRRINGPVGGTIAPVFAIDKTASASATPDETIEGRTRPPNVARPIYLKTGSTPSASGSAYLEIQTSTKQGSGGGGGGGACAGGLKLHCIVHGPRALPQATPFASRAVLTTHVKYAPFATKLRRGYVRDAAERDLGVHLETALRGAILADRWPKSGIDVLISVIEGDQDRSLVGRGEQDEAWETMNVLAGCVTVASAALVDAGIDCVDTIAGGVAALVEGDREGSAPQLVVDPLVSQHRKILAACCVAYLPERDEVTNVWFKGDVPAADTNLYMDMVEKGIVASQSAKLVLAESLVETMERINGV